MPARIVSDTALPHVAVALAARGLTMLSGSVPNDQADAMLVTRADMPRPAVARVRGCGWAGPLMLLVERAEQVVEALDAGADEALTIASDPVEIAARLAARVRATGSAWNVGPLTLDPIARDASRDGRSLALLPREYALLAYLARHNGRTVPRSELLRAVWRLNFDPGTNVVQVHVSRLRARLDPPGAPRLLLTERGTGYRLAIE